MMEVEPVLDDARLQALKDSPLTHDYPYIGKIVKLTLLSK